MSRDQRIIEHMSIQLRDIRLQRDMTQKQVSDYAGITKNTLSLAENGQKSLRSVDLFKVAQALQCPMGDLFPKVGSDY